MNEKEERKILIEEIERLIKTASFGDVQVVYRYLISSVINSGK